MMSNNAEFANGKFRIDLSTHMDTMNILDKYSVRTVLISSYK